MAYTSADLTAVDEAIAAYRDGTRVTRVTHGAKTVQYAELPIQELKSLRIEIISEINQTASRPRFVFTRSTKGL